MERWAGDLFSDRYFATHLPRNCRQKYLRANQYSTKTVEQRSIRRICTWILCRGYGVNGESLRYSKFGATSLYVFEYFLRYNCARPSYLFVNEKQRDFKTPRNWQPMKQELRSKPLIRCWRKKSAWTPPPRYYTLDVYNETPILHSRGYYRRCGRIGSA